MKKLKNQFKKNPEFSPHIHREKIEFKFKIIKGNFLGGEKLIWKKFQNFPP